MNFSPHELNTIASALRVACEVYGKDAEACASTPTLADAFLKQQHEAAKLCERIEEATS